MWLGTVSGYSGFPIWLGFNKINLINNYFYGLVLYWGILGFLFGWVLIK